jgi:hypothetical protein
MFVPLFTEGNILGCFIRYPPNNDKKGFWIGFGLRITAREEKRKKENAWGMGEKSRSSAAGNG